MKYKIVHWVPNIDTIFQNGQIVYLTAEEILNLSFRFDIGIVERNGEHRLILDKKGSSFKNR